jgi:ParB family transcriptional regulator, chromosome partitioning protein
VQNEKAGKTGGGVSRETSSDAEATALAADLAVALGLGVEIKHDHRKGGVISITYRTLEQLDDLCRRLTAHHR